ncbi:protein FAM151A-like [Ciona intestinalis]
MGSSIDADTKRQRYFKLIKYALAAACLLITLGFVIGILYAVIDYYVTPNSVRQVDSTTMNDVSTTQVLPTEGLTTDASFTNATTPAATTNIDMESIYLITGGGMFEYFKDKNNDGLNIKFSHATNGYTEVDEAFAANKNALEADITLQIDENHQQTEIPIMAHPPAVRSDYTLDEWLDVIIASDKAIKMDIKITEVIPYALEILRLHGPTLHQPVWINADVVKGPNTNSEPIDPNIFLQEVNSKFPNVTLSLGWTTGYRNVGPPNEKYSWDAMDEMLSLSRPLNQLITYPARAALLRESWDRFLWLLEQSNSYTLTIWSSTTDVVSVEDMVFVRDNFDISRIFYDAEDALTDPLIEAINANIYPKKFYTGGNVLDCFKIPNREALSVTWEHRANTIDILQPALNDSNLMMLEADVRLYGEGTSQINESLPVMSHDPPALNYDYTLEAWLQEILSRNVSKGLKLDFKSLGALKASLDVLSNMKSELTVPIWLNSDILMGPNSITRPVNATEFFRLTQSVFPDSMLSPGWTTTYRQIGENEIYTRAMVEEMYSHCSSVRSPITFPVRASLTRPSIPNLQWLLAKSNRYSLTVWHSTSEKVTTEELLEIYNSFGIDKVYFDLPEEILNALIKAIDNQKKMYS